MRYYTYTRGLYKNPEYRYFNSIKGINIYYGIDSREDDYDRGYSFEYEGKTYFLGCDDEDEEIDY